MSQGSNEILVFCSHLQGGWRQIFDEASISLLWALLLGKRVYPRYEAPGPTTPTREVLVGVAGGPDYKLHAEVGLSGRSST